MLMELTPEHAGVLAVVVLVLIGLAAAILVTDAARETAEHPDGPRYAAEPVKVLPEAGQDINTSAT